MKLPFFLIGFAMLCANDPSAAQGSQRSAVNSALDHQQCQSEVLKFERVISFIREAQGERAAAEVKEKMLPAKTEAELLTREGYCGLARYLRDKKLVG